jgi:hypothetical protein
MMESPPNASKAKLPAASPNAIEPKVSTAIHVELRYSTQTPLRILILLQELCAGLQQQELQFEQSLGAWQLAHEVSLQPHVWQESDEYPNGIEMREPFFSQLICLAARQDRESRSARQQPRVLAPRRGRARNPRGELIWNLRRRGLEA